MDDLYNWKPDPKQAEASSRYLNAAFDAAPEAPPERSLPGEMASGLKRGLYITAPQMIGGAMKAFSPVDSGAYQAGTDLQDSAKAIAALPEMQRGANSHGMVGDTLIAGAEGIGQMTPVLAGGIINPALGAGIAGTMYGGSTYQDTKERMLQQEGLDDSYAAAHPDDARVRKAKLTGLATGTVQGVGDAAMSYLGGRFLKGVFPALGKQTAQGVVRGIAGPGRETLKRFGKAWGAEILGEGITEAAQDEGQAAIERAAGLKDAPAFGAQALDSAQGGVGMAMLLGPLAGPGHYSMFRDARQVQRALVDPSTDPAVRTAAARVMGNEIAKVDQSAAANFLDHAHDAIGDEQQTGSAPYALNLDDTTLLEPFVRAANPGPSSDDSARQSPVEPITPPGTSLVAREPGGELNHGAGIDNSSLLTLNASPGVVFNSDIPNFASPLAGVSPRQTSLQPIATPEAPPLSLTPHAPAGPLSRALARVMPDSALPEARPVAPQVSLRGIATPVIDAEYSEVLPALPAPPSEMDKAHAWAKDEIASGRGLGLMQGYGVSPEQHDANILKRYRSAVGGGQSRATSYQSHATAAPNISEATPNNSETAPNISEVAPKIQPSINKRRQLDPTRDDMVVAMAKLGGVDLKQAKEQWGTTVGDDAKELNRHAGRAGGTGIAYAFKSGGLPLDRMREALVEHGYLPERATVNDLADAVHAAARGNHTYSSQSDVESRLDRAEQEWLDRHDLSQALKLTAEDLDKAGIATEDEQLVVECYHDVADVLVDLFDELHIESYEEVKQLIMEVRHEVRSALTDFTDAQDAGAEGEAVAGEPAEERSGGGGQVGGDQGREAGNNEQGTEYSSPLTPHVSPVTSAESSNNKEDASDSQSRETAQVARDTTLDVAAHEAATSPHNNTPEPTPAQIEAGNYKKGHVDFQGLDISIENPAGSTRRGVDPNGKAWETSLAHHYGYIKGTIGRDKDHIDVFIGDNHDSDKVFVVDQVDPGTGKFDEHKVMLGFDSSESARDGYLDNYDQSGKARIGALTEATMEEFKQWLKMGNTKRAFAPARNKARFEATRRRLLTKKIQEAREPAEQARLQKILDKLKASEQRPVNSEQENASPRTPHPSLSVESRASSTTSEPSSTADVGAELWANRRNHTGRGIAWDEVKDLNDTMRVKEVTKPKVWPRPDYEQMVNDGLHPVFARILKNIYDGIATGPIVKTDESLQRYITTVNRVRDALMEWMQNHESQKRFADSLVEGARRMAAGSSGQRIALSELGKGDDFTKAFLEKLWPEEMKKPSYGRFGRGTEAHGDLVSIGGNRAMKALQITSRDMAKFLKEVEGGWPGKREAWQVQGYSVQPSETIQIQKAHRYVTDDDGTRHTEEVWYTRVAGSYPKLEAARAALTGKGAFLLLDKSDRIKGGFATREEAEAAARELATKKGDGGGRDLRGMNITDAERRGPERRGTDENISSQRFMETFGFKGVNFGRKGYINDAERQEYLNHAYDALVDLAEIVDVPIKALSLNGELGIAFGAQGRGGSAAAHFVPGVNEINMTKTMGAGTLAHEWAHALDHWFGVKAGLGKKDEPFLSEHVGYLKSTIDTTGIRPEIVQAFEKIVQSMTRRPQTEHEWKMRQAAAINRSTKNVESWLKHARLQFEQMVKGDNKEARLREFDALSRRIVAGDLGDGYVKSGNLAFRPTVAALRNLFKDATGRLLDKQTSNAIQVWARDETTASEAKQATPEHMPQVATDFERDSLAKDKEKKGRKYWSTKTEMFARAFESFVNDKLAEGGLLNTFLTDAGLRAAMRNREDTGYVSPYPRNQERETINDAFRALVDTIEARETEKGTALLSRSAGTVRVDTPLSVEDAGDVIRNFLKFGKFGGRVTLKLADSFDSLPDKVRTAAEDAGGTKDNTYAVLHKDGSVWLIRDAHATREQLETSIFHEVYGHLGMFRLFGVKSIQSLNRLFNRLGGYDGLAAIADKHGVREVFDKYWQDAQAERVKGMQNARITAELLALIGQKSPSLVRKAQEVWGAFRQALRKIGLMELAHYNDSDLAYLLAQGRKALRKAGNGGEFTVLMTAKFSAEAPNTSTTPALEEDQHQYDEVVKRYHGTPLWMKAPNGKPTNLTEQQWVQVRTPAFKDKFGNWEAVAAQREIGKLGAVELSGNEIAEFNEPLNMDDLRKKAANYSGRLENKVYNRFLGAEIEIRKNGIKQTLAHGSGPDKIKSIAALDALIKNGVPVFCGRSTHTEQKSYVVAHPMNIGTNRFMVSLGIKEDQNGMLFYDHELIKIEALNEVTSQAGDAGTRQPPSPRRGLLNHYTKWIFKVKPDSVSIMADKNGEPLMPIRVKDDRSTYSTATSPSTPAATIDAALKSTLKLSRIPIRVVQSISDLPRHIQIDMSLYGIEAIDGVFDPATSSMYLVADYIPSVERARELLRHEWFHAGVADKELEALYRYYSQKDMDRLELIADERGFDLSSRSGRLEAAGELAAQLAETDPHNLFLARILAKVKEWLRALGLQLEIGQAEVAGIIRDAIQRVQTGEARMHGARAMTGSAYSAAEQHGDRHVSLVQVNDRLFDGNRKAAQEWLVNPDNGIIGDYTNDDTGMIIAVSKRMLERKGTSGKAVSKSDDAVDHFEAMRVLPELIKKAVWVQKESDRNKGSNITAVHKFAVPVQVKEKTYAVKLTVKTYEESGIGNKYYTHELVGIEMPPVITPISVQGHNPTGTARTTGGTSSYITLSQLIHAVNAKDVLNGEPESFKISYSISRQNQQIAAHAKAINAPAKVADMTKGLFELIGQNLPNRFKASIGTMLSNPWFGSEGRPVRRMVVNLNIARSFVRNQIIFDLFKSSEGYTGIEGLHKLLKKATTAELKQFNDLIKYGDRNDVARTFTRDELYRGKTPFGKLSRTVVESYKAFHEIIQAANRVRFEKLAEIALLPYKNEAWFPELQDMLQLRMKLDGELGAAHEVAQLGKLLSSTRRRMGDKELFGDNNPTGKPVTAKVAEAYMKFMDKLEVTSEPGLVRMAYKHITEYRGELDKLKNEWGYVKGYAPRMRKDGDWHVSVYRVDEEGNRTKVYMMPTITEGKAKRHVETIRKDLKSHLKSNYAEGARYEVGYERNTATPSELLGDRGKEQAIEQLIMTAFDNAHVFKTSAEDLAAMKRAVLDEVNKQIMAQGFGRHGISREKTQIEGYRDDDYVSVLKEYISGMAGWLSKMQYAVEVNRESERISAANPEDKVWVHDYFKDSMKVSTYMDEVAATARSVGAVWYLGGKVSSAILNAFQNYTVGQAVLAGMMKKAGRTGEPILMLAKAQKDVMAHVMGKGTLTDEEQEVLRQAVRQGTAHAQTVRFMSGLNEQGFGGRWKKVTEAAMTPFALVEQYLNREPGVLAAYRAFKTTPKGQFDQAAFAKAEEFTNSAHFLMGNENLPELVRKMGALGKTLYLFQGYTHNYLLLMANALKNGEFEVIARSLGAIAALGGVFALPGADDLDKWITKWFGVSYKLKFKMWMKRNAREYGSAGEALEAFVNHGATSVFGVDMSRALAVNLPFVSDPDKTVGERMAGVWGGMVQKPFTALHALGSGQIFRAMESIAPEMIANPMRAYRQATTGATTLAGKPVLDETGHQMQYSGLDVTKKVLGFQPLEVSERTQLKSSGRGLQVAWDDERKDHLAALRVARTREALRTAIQDVIAWNHRLNQSQAKGLVRPISSDSIQRARRFKLGSGDKRRMAWEQEYVD